MNNRLYYFAYGSNLHPVRLSRRVPSARLTAVATLAEHTLRFHKRGKDESGKCNAFYTGQPEHHVLGAVYEIAAEEKPILDDHEGPGYEVKSLTVTRTNEPLDVFAYIATESHIDEMLQPYTWYRKLVHLGARHLGFPESYFKAFLAVNALPDPNVARLQRGEHLIDQIRCQQ
jgi:hypothetical protein